MSPEEMHESYQDTEHTVRSLAKDLIQEGDIREITLSRMAQEVRNLDMLHFGINHFHRVFDVVDDEESKKIGDGSGFYQKYTYTCDQWNQETGLCNCHTTRPWVCESFICGAAAEGRVPTRKDFAYSAQISDEDAKRILEARNNPAHELCKDVEVLDETSS